MALHDGIEADLTGLPRELGCFLKKQGREFQALVVCTLLECPVECVHEAYIHEALTRSKVISRA